MKVIHKIELNKFQHALSLAVAQSRSHFEHSVDKAMELYDRPEDCPEAIKCDIDAIYNLARMLSRQFWDTANKLIPKRYKDNDVRCCYKTGNIEIMSELKKPVEDSGVSLDEIMNEAGVQNVDEWGKA